MSCTTCQGSCSCNGTMKSRRCACANDVVSKREQTFCEPTTSLNPLHYVPSVPDATDVYGGGLRKSDLQQLKYFTARVDQRSREIAASAIYRPPFAYP